MINDEEVRHVLQAICTEMAQIRQILERTFPDPSPRVINAPDPDDLLLTHLVNSAKSAAAAIEQPVPVPVATSGVVIGEFTYKPLESQ